MNSPVPKRHAPRGRLKANHLDRPDLLEGRCTARSKRSGVQCKRFPIPGGTVCVMHGGGAPQVQHAAEARLQALIHPAITRLAQLVAQMEFPSVAIAAVKDVLDRNMGKAAEQMKVTGADDGPVRHIFTWQK